jgi:hypothetical protein
VNPAGSGYCAGWWCDPARLSVAGATGLASASVAGVLSLAGHGAAASLAFTGSLTLGCIRRAQIKWRGPQAGGTSRYPCSGQRTINAPVAGCVG